MSLANQVAHKHVVLVVVAHSDDETIGAGATIRKFVDSGSQVFAMHMTDGVGSRKPVKGGSQLREKSANLASLELGFQWVFKGDFPDNQLDSVPILTIIREIERIKKEIKPSYVITHSPADLNIDHRIVANAVLTTFRPTPTENWTDIVSMEIPSSTDFGHQDFFGRFNPNFYVPISDTWLNKLKALEHYSQEIYSTPHSRSLSGIDALATLRGHESGYERAEAFQIIRKIMR
jgi:LmbE family N-acetylglucosaminyl deacetylase